MASYAGAIFVTFAADGAIANQSGPSSRESSFELAAAVYAYISCQDYDEYMQDSVTSPFKHKSNAQ